MKQTHRLLTTLLLLLATLTTAYAQEFVGSWRGDLVMGPNRLPLVFHIEQSGNHYTGTMDSPAQGAMGIPATQVQVSHNTLTLEVAPLGLSYRATRQDNHLEGTFQQGDLQLPLQMEKFIPPTKAPQQTPSQPQPYREEEVTFTNPQADSIALAGTLTLPPHGSHVPAVVLVTGSGPQDRNETLFGYQPFAAIADTLTRAGIAVLRYDDRGVGQSGGHFVSATTTDFATDAHAAIRYLATRPEVNPRSIGIIGHSEGALVASILADQHPDEVAFIILLAGPGLTGEEIVVEQLRSNLTPSMPKRAEAERAIQKNIELVRATAAGTLTSEQLESQLQELYNLTKPLYGEATMPVSEEQFVATSKEQFTSPWYQQFIRLDPSAYLSQVSCPILVLFGELDSQVRPQPNLKAILQATTKGGNQQLQSKVYPRLNHLFRESVTGHISEYATQRTPFSPEVLTDMVSWILATTPQP